MICGGLQGWVTEVMHGIQLILMMLQVIFRSKQTIRLIHISSFCWRYREIQNDPIRLLGFWSRPYFYCSMKLFLQIRVSVVAGG
jgi:hypothetical protein